MSNLLCFTVQFDKNKTPNYQHSSFKIQKVSKKKPNKIILTGDLISCFKFNDLNLLLPYRSLSDRLAKLPGEIEHFFLCVKISRGIQAF